MPRRLVDALQYAHKNREAFLDQLVRLVKIPSVSTDPTHQADMQTAAQWLAQELTNLKFTRATVFQTPLHPIVYAQRMDAGPHAPVILIYGHYDVQPADPLELWSTEPFAPAKLGENVYGRGASDMKGQIVAVLSALKAIDSTGPMPVNLKFILEGEEEIGSPNLAEFLREHKELLSCSYALNADGGILGEDIPAIVYGLRGLVYYELRVTGPEHDLHSGAFGGVVQNPAIVLADLISGLHDQKGRITLPGFYDSVRPINPTEHEAMAKLPLDEEFYLNTTGAPRLWGEDGYLPAERVGARPSLDINGLLSGFTGSGSKTVIPSWAMAKISLRLVPDQNPDVVRRQLEQYLNEHAPATVKWQIIDLAGSPASLTDLNLPAARALAKSMEEVWGKKPLYKREGGSIPVVLEMKETLGVDTVLTGFGLPDDNLHAPNEKLHLPTWYKGIDTLVHFFFLVGESN